MSSILRKLVSKHKRRYQENGFDLDLAFIDCPPTLENRLLAMSFPTEGKEAWYRNHWKDVKRFLEYWKSKGDGTFKVYNLTAEKPTYQAERLGGELSEFPFEDHQVPSLNQMLAFCSDLDDFLSRHPANFAAVHCKAGKGRTGVMICAYLLHKRLANNAAEAMDSYARQRSMISSGITVPSQRRYVQYFEACVAEQQILEAQEFCLESISVSGYSRQQLSGLVVVLSTRADAMSPLQPVALVHSSQGSVRMMGGSKYGAAVPAAKLHLPSTSSAPEPSSSSCCIQGDFRIEVYAGRVTSSKLLFRTCLNTAFLSKGNLVLLQHELDKGTAPVKSEVVLTLQLGEAPRKRNGPEGASQQQGSGKSLQQGSPHADGLIGVANHVTYESIQGTFCPHLFEVHPDFSIPSNYYPASPANEEDPLAPAPSMFSHAAAQQLPSARDRGLHTDGSSVKDLRDRLVKLVENDERLNESRRAHSMPTSWTDYLPNIKPIPRTLSLAKLRPEYHGEKYINDPELNDYSAPTTPSLPRPFTSIDWQQSSASAPAPLYTRISDDNEWQTSFAPGSHTPEGPISPLNSGPDSPSHAAQMIKWMSSSWWLSMA